MHKIINLSISLKWISLIVWVLLLGYPIGYFVLNSNKLYSSTSIPISTKGIDGIGVYIINLDRSKERYEYINNYIKYLGLKSQRIPAVNGSALSIEEIKEKVDLKSYRTFLGHLPKLGTIGCYLSHIKAWEKFLSSNFEFALIFEDDTSFEPNKLKVIIEDLLKHTELWDLTSFEISHNGFPLKIKNLTNNNYLAIYLMEVTHAGAYIINRKAATNLLEKALPIKMPIDHYFTRTWELDIKFTGVENPRIVYQTFGDSDINITKNISNEKLNILESFKHIIYKLQSYLIRFFYNLKLYLITHLKK